MATVDKGGTVTLQELVVSSLAQTDALSKLLIEKGVITQDEFMEKITAERATHQAMFRQKGKLEVEDANHHLHFSHSWVYWNDRVCHRIWLCHPPLGTSIHAKGSTFNEEYFNMPRT